MNGYKLTEVRVFDLITGQTIKIYRGKHASIAFETPRKQIRCAPFQCTKTDAGLRYTCPATSLSKKLPSSAIADCYFEEAE